MIEPDSKRSWFVLIGTWFTVVLTVVPTFGSLSVFSYTWIQQFKFTTGEIGWLSATLAVMFVIGPLENMILHKLGFWKTELLSSLLLSMGIISTAFSTQFWHLMLSYSLLLGFGAALMQQIQYPVVDRYFDKYKSLVFALTHASTSVGLLISPTVMEQLFRKVDYRYSLTGLGGITFITGCAMTGIHFWSSNNETKDSLSTRSSSVELDVKNNNLQTISGELDGEKFSDEVQEIKSDIQIWKVHFTILKDIYFYLIFFNYFFAGAAQSVFVTYIIDFAVTSGYVTSELAAFGQTSSGIAAFVAALLLAGLMRFNQRPFIFNMVTGLISGVAVFCFPFVKTVIPFFVLNSINGFSEAMRMANIMNLIENYYGSHNDTRVAYIFGANGLGFVLGPLIAAQIINVYSMQIAFFAAGGFSIVAPLLTVPILIRKYCFTTINKE